MVSLDRVPDGLDDIRGEYGEPDPDANGNFNAAFLDRECRLYKLPFPLVIGWREQDYRDGDRSALVRSAIMHRKIGPAVVDALDEIGRHEGGAYLDRNRLNLWWGCFAYRFKRGGDELSTHSWAIAVDLNRHLGRLGEEPQMPSFIVDAFEKRGFVWGGRWDRPDGMHFQACTGY